MNEENDTQLLEWMSRFANNGVTMIHLGVAYSVSNGQLLECLQSLYDQCHHPMVDEMIGEIDRQGFRELCNKYQLIKTPKYRESMSAGDWEVTLKQKTP